MAVGFSQFFPKKSKLTLFGQKYSNKAFLVLNLGFLFFAPNFAIRQIRGGWFQIWQYCFKFQPKIAKSGCFGPILEKDKLEDADFKYDNSIFKILAETYPNKTFLVKNIQIKDFWSQICAFLFSGEILQLDKCEGADF